LTLELTNPTENGVTAEKMLKVGGVTQPNTAVVVFSQDNQASGQSNDAGLFEVEIDLGEGINDLMVVAVAADGQDKSVVRQITYSPTGNTESKL